MSCLWWLKVLQRCQKWRVANGYPAGNLPFSSRHLRRWLSLSPGGICILSNSYQTSMLFWYANSNLIYVRIKIYQTWFILITTKTWKGWEGWKEDFLCKKRCPCCRSRLLDHLVDPSIIFQEFVSSVAWPRGIWGTSEYLLPCWGCEFFTVFWNAKRDVANMLGESFGEGCSCKPVFWEVKTKQNGRGWYVPPHFPIPAGLKQWPSPPSHPWEPCTALASLPPGRVSRWETTTFVVCGRIWKFANTLAIDTYCICTVYTHVHK